MPTLIAFCRAALLILVACALSACSSTHAYKIKLPENMSIMPDVRTGSARLHVYDIDNKCNMYYQGTVELSEKIKIGLPVNKLSYLDFNFSSTSLFTGSHSTSYGVYLTPRAGYHYDAVVSYVDEMYGATIHEQDTHGGGRHEVPSIVPKACASK